MQRIFLQSPEEGQTKQPIRTGHAHDGHVELVLGQF